ncbi:DUF5050 domain-containing protein [Clostridium sp. ZS2-4]|uniref:DUF5050 domain-containing protein n=1 Tax=Clostridium sp. ZS2-4 TaxID=2987703 RepID=UPI00227AB6C3|nr:DUF5050 domain-containing protein [Clostridium sp. ZS2-4]MCY6354748.1 DUF5050 domain-containing protein [Clostridium sp. ZS2-4]
MKKRFLKIVMYLILVIIFSVYLIKQYSPRFKAQIYTFKTSIQIEHINFPKETIFKRLFNNETVKTKNYLIYKKNNYTIYKSDLNGGNELLLYSGKDEVGSLLVDDIYITDDWIIFQDCAGILRINLNTNKKERLFNGLVSNIQVKDDLIYFMYMADNNRLYRMSVNAENLVRISLF